MEITKITGVPGGAINDDTGVFYPIRKNSCRHIKEGAMIDSKLELYNGGTPGMIGNSQNLPTRLRELASELRSVSQAIAEEMGTSYLTDIDRVVYALENTAAGIVVGRELDEIAAELEKEG